MRSDRDTGFVFRRRYAEDGFTLIEVMVALAVFGLAALALIRLESATIRGAATLDGTVLAQMVAESVAVDAVTSAQPPVLGPAQGAMVDGGRNWTWTRVVSPSGGGGILRVDVSVADARGQVLGRLTMVRPGTVS
ncbi:type II secretion system minor pseudopilin GspI [Sphingomonas bacterium]|uniref:type II secretion system minor pseudopilin GspI n=1 Tax=Sphingomonas bacterium TaxID=1895847 RepID=UPI001576E619|nr:type II secretion system minor pseudopilin GspI [Sphingomonas bacterium]